MFWYVNYKRKPYVTETSEFICQQSNVMKLPLKDIK